MSTKTWISLAASLVLITGWVLVGSAQKEQEITPPFSAHDKLAYADPYLLDFVRPGLVAKLEEPIVGTDRRIRVKVRITDPKGLGLDRSGVVTPGAVSMSLIGAHLPDPDGQYVAYTTRNQTSPITRVTAVQAATDSGGSWEKVADGLYQYTFGTVLPANYNRSETHAIGLYATRDLTEFDLDRQYANDVIEFVPDASHPPADRAITVTTNCNNCHDPLTAHGEVRRDVRLCVLCHTAQTTDPDTGNTVDFKVMIHKIHRGETLPSVQSGKPYQIIGFGGAVADYSTVRFPDDLRNCERCHSGASQSLHFMTKPSQAACGACHDDVDFSTGVNHQGVVQTDDTQCRTCHIPQGDVEFDLSIKGAHTVPTESQALPGVVFKILGVDNATPGSRPTVRFSVTDKMGLPISPATMASLSLIMAGPTTDYATSVRDDARQAAGGGLSYSWTMSRPLAADFKGSIAIGMEGYRNVTLTKFDNSTLTVRDAGFNQVSYFDTGGNAAIPRRAVIKLEGCNSCHGDLRAHGGSRMNTEYCILCHTPSESDRARRPADKQPVESIHFKTLIHKIHTGEELERDFTIYGFGGTANNFNEIRFPGDRRDCVKCHIDGSQQVPLPDTNMPTISPRDWLTTMPPETASCLSCHTSRAAAVHAQLNSSPLGEACAVCHGVRGEFAVNKVHAR
jgi:OmcA/MtrC family decaheme c-type cytochrome